MSRRVKVKLGKKLSAAEHPVTKGLADAERLLGARRGPPDEADRPPPSTFPMPPAAREALRLNREKH